MTTPPPQDDPLALSVVVPVYNGAGVIEHTVSALAAHLATGAGPAELIVVDDGSTDGTADRVRTAAAAAAVPVRLLRNERNRGKGAAIARGMQAARGNERVFVDADLAYGPEEIDRIRTALGAGADVAVASRAHPDSVLAVRAGTVWYFLLRHIVGRILNVLVRAFLLPGITDSQAGLKGFRKAAAERLFAGWLPKGFSFDAALLFRTRRLGLRIEQVPVLYRHEREPTTVHMVRDAARVLRDLITIRVRMVAGRYEQGRSVLTARQQQAHDSLAAVVLSPPARAILAGAFGMALLAVVTGRLAAGGDALSIPAWLALLTIIVVWAWRADLAGTPTVPRLPWTRPEKIAFAVLFLAGAALRFVHLGSLPPMIHGDSADCGLLGMDLLHGTVSDVFDFSPWYSTPYLSFLPYTLSFALHGLSVASLRLPSALYGTLAIVPLYFLVRGWFGIRTALLATTLFVTSHAAIHFSRIGLWNVQVLFYELAAFAFLTDGLRRGRMRPVAAAGIVSGLALYSYTGGRLTVIVAFTFLAFQVLRGARRAHLRAALWYGFAVCVTAVPLFLSYVKHPEVLTQDRTASVWVLAEENRHHVAETLGTTSVAGIFAEQIKRTFAGFVSRGDSSAQYGTGQPLCSPITAVLALAGLILVVLRVRDPRYLFLLLWAGLGLLLGSVVVINPPAYTRLIVLFPLPGLLAALAVDAILIRLGRRVSLHGADAVALCTLVIVQSALFNLHGYRAFTSAMARESREWDVLKVMERSAGDSETFLYTGPFVLADSPIFRLFSGGQRAVNGFTEADIPGRLTRDAVFVLAPGFGHIGIELSARFPGIERESVRQAGTRQLLVYRCTADHACREGEKK